MDQCKSTLSAPRQKLLQIMQQLNFGKIELVVQGSEPSFSPPPRIIREIKLGVDAQRRDPQNENFNLKRHVTDLFDHFGHVRNGAVVTIEVRHGLPARLIVTAPDEA